jgi:hypothetical protein
MLKVENLEDNLIELHPFGSFPVWGMREVRKTELPEYEPKLSSEPNLIVA